jgi:DNA-binding transcriptional ArsR family regulator
LVLRSNRPGHILNYMVQYTARLDSSFAALSDRTRRRVLERLGRGDASITELATTFEMTLTGIKKHVQVLEGAGLVTTKKVGRVRLCWLGPQRLDHEVIWIEKYRAMLEARLDRLGAFLERTSGDQP